MISFRDLIVVACMLTSFGVMLHGLEQSERRSRLQMVEACR